MSEIISDLTVGIYYAIWFFSCIPIAILHVIYIIYNTKGYEMEDFLSLCIIIGSWTVIYMAFVAAVLGMYGNW